MSTPAVTPDPRIQQILDAVRARMGQAPVDTVPTPIASQITTLGQPTPPPLPPPSPVDVSMPAQPQLPVPAPPQVTQAAPPPEPAKPGPVKSFLQSLAYGGGQAMLKHVGLPTDYEKQQDALKVGLQQQQQNSIEGLRQSQADLASGKLDQLSQITAPYSIAKDDQSVLPQFRGAATTFGGYQALQKLSGTTQGKTDVANIGATAKTDVAQTNADSHERLAEAQLAVRQAIADRNYGLAATRLKLAGSNASLRQLEYRMRAYGTGADGQPLPGVEFTAEGFPVGTATQANVRPTTNARNAGERAETMQDLATRIQGALNDPEIRSQIGPVMGRVNDLKGQAGVLDGPLAELRNDLVSYGAFQAGLHPVRGIGGLQYFDKVMGGLGQSPEQLLAKIASNNATAKSVTNVAGKGSTAPAKPGMQAFTDNGTTYNIPASQVAEFKKDHPNAR